jgi:succinyl-diaminopimelate desuccinylase
MEGVSALLIGESTHHDVVVAHKGALWVEVICYGKTAHGSTPDQGVNAIVHMNRFLNALLDRFELVYEPDPLLGHPTFNVAVIEGGVKTNVVPDRCSVQIDFRTVPGQRHEDIVTALNRLLDELHEEDATFRGEVRVFNDLPPVGTDPDDPFVQTVVHSVREVVGRDPAVRGMNGYTDGAALAPPHSPVPLVILGGGDDHMAHQPDESVELEAFLQSIDVYKTVIRRYLA